MADRFAPQSINANMGTPSTSTQDSLGVPISLTKGSGLWYCGPGTVFASDPPPPMALEVTVGFGAAPLPGEGVHPPKPPPHAGFPIQHCLEWAPCLGSCVGNGPIPCTYDTELGAFPL